MSTMKKITIKTKRLTESVKSFDSMSDAEFDQIMDGILDKIDSVRKVKYSTDIDSRVKKVQQDFTDPMAIRDLEREDRANRGVDKRKKATREREKEKYAPKHYKSFADLINILYRSIADQVEEIEDEEETWAVPHHRADEDPAIMQRGIRLDDQPGDVPSLDVYFDQSGSWDARHLKVGTQAIRHLRHFEEQKELVIRIFYFADNVVEEANLVRGATHAWPHILENIKKTGAENVLIMSDSDLETQSNPQSTVVVNGGVWFLWRDGDASTRIARELIGKRTINGGNQFSFDTTAMQLDDDEEE